MRTAFAGLLAGALAGALVGLPAGLAGVALSTSRPASAQAASEGDSGRFAFHKTEDGYLRLDSRTGQVSLCSRKPVGWACHPAPEERIALEGEIARLQNENGQLKKELLARGAALPGAVKPAEQPAPSSPAEPGASAGASPNASPDKQPGPPPDRPRAEPAPPADSELDKVLAFMERAWRRLTETMGAIQRDYFGKI